MITVFNGAKGRLNGGLTPSSSSLALDSTYTPDNVNYGGDAFWNSADATTKPTTGRPMSLVVIEYNDMSGTESQAIASGMLRHEIMRCTAISSHNFTISERGVGETSAESFNTTSYVYNLVLAQDILAIQRMALRNKRNTSIV